MKKARIIMVNNREYLFVSDRDNVDIFNLIKQLSDENYNLKNRLVTIVGESQGNKIVLNPSMIVSIEEFDD